MDRYAVGVDFGTLSGRTVLVNVKTGQETAHAVFEYPHAVMDSALPDGTRLEPDWALHHPQDYLDVLRETIPSVLQKAGVSPEQVIGIGVDVTACTVMPALADGTPLCFTDAYAGNPHAYIKLWKHHAAQYAANRLSEVAAARGEPWLARYGGKISSEWFFPKLMQIVDEAPEVYDAMDCFIEVTDWVVWQLCGKQTRNSCTAGYKSMWHKQDGFPNEDFFAALHPKLRHVVAEKIGCPVTPLGAKAGELTAQAAALTGLCPGTAVAVGNVDAHVCVPAVKIDGPGKMLAIMGTSTCHMLMGTKEQSVPGICGVVEDGILPGFFGYEAGQSCVGDHFAWFIEQCLPAAYYEQARAAGVNIHAFLRQKAECLKPGESGLLALDWWNGNRSILVDADLTGMMLGMTLATKPEEIYRALIEATAFGTKILIENYKDHGVPVDSFIASGGISQKDPMTMQIYADVIDMPIRIAGSKEGPALGSAIFGAVAAGAARGGYDQVYEAARAMGKLDDKVYTPKPENVKIYARLFEEYRRLHDYFGRGDNDVMKRLKAIKHSQRA